MSCPEVIRIVTPGPPGPTLQVTGPALAGRASGTGSLQSIGLGSGLAIVNGALTLTGAGSGTVTSVGLSVPTGLSVAGTPITGAGTLAITFAAGYSLPTTAKQGDWDTAYSERLRWDGGATGLDASTARSSLGLGGAALLAVGTTAGTVAAGDDGRLSDSREWSAETVSQAEAEAGTATTRRAWTAQRVFQAVAAWWAASAAKTKLDGIASGATANSSDATLLNRANHTGTQAAGTITGLGGAALLNVGTSAGTVAAGDDSRLSTDLSYTVSTRTLASSTGADVTLPLFDASGAGLVPATGTPSGKYLKDDGTWATVAAGASPAGSGSELQFRSSGSAFGAVTGSSVDASGNITLGSRWTVSVNGAASAPPVALTGTWFTGGTATTTKPHFLIEPANTTSTAWNTSGTGFGVNAPSGFPGNLLDLQVNGTSQASITSAGRLSLGASRQQLAFGYRSGSFSTTAWELFIEEPSVGGRLLGFTLNSLQLSSGKVFGWSSAGNDPLASLDVVLSRDAAGTLAQRNGTNAQTFRVYNTYTSGTNYELGKLEWSSNVFRIGTEKGSVGGTARALELQTDGTTRVQITRDGVYRYSQPAPAAVDTTATLTIANLQAGIITTTTAAAVDMTLPTGTLTEGGFAVNTNDLTFEWSVINTGSNAATVLAGTDHTIVGAGAVTAGTTGRFATRRTAANTYVTYRIS